MEGRVLSMGPMWNKSREVKPSSSAPVENPPAHQPQPAPQPSAPPPAQSYNPPAQSYNPPAQRTVFGKSMKIVGDVTSDDELQLEGELEGKLTLKSRLTIGPASNVKGNIKAKEVVIAGTVHGNVEAQDRITLRTGANLVGDIKTAGIVIEDGAYFKGGIDISRPDAANSNGRATGAAAGQKR